MIRSLFAVVLTVATLVSCLHPTTSAVRQAISAEVSILDFGADPVAVDNRAAIQAALTAGAGGVVHVPAGTWTVGRWGNGYLCLSIPAGTTLAGEGRDASRIVMATGTARNVRMLVPSADVTIRDLTLDGGDQTAIDTVGGVWKPDEHRAAIFATNAPRLKILRVTAQGFSGDGFYVYNHSDDPTITDVLATGNLRDGIVFGGGTTGGSVTASTFRGNRAQQWDTEGGPVLNLTVSGNIIDGTGSNDYAMTATGGSATARSSGWLISNNTFTGGLELLWIDSTLVTLNHGINATTKPAVSLWRTTNDVTFTGNSFTNTNTTQLNSAVVLIAGTGTGSATTGFRAQGNVLVATGHPSTFGYRVEGAVSVEIRDDVLIGPGIAGSGVGIVLHATNAVENFKSATLRGNTIRNWGSLGVAVAGNGAARLDTLDIAYNNFDDTSDTMHVALSLDKDRAHAAKDVRLVGNVLSGGVTTMLAAVPSGAWAAWGDRWVTP